VGVMSEIQHWKQVDFNSHILDIRDKKHWWTTVDVGDYEWNAHMKLIDTHPQELHDWNSEKQRFGMNSFHLRPSAPLFCKQVFEDMDNFFIPPAPKKENYKKGHPQITNIAFTGFGNNHNSYPRHKDSMDVFLVQVIGEIPIRIGKSKEDDSNDDFKIMQPGDAVWIPRGTYHKLSPKMSRLTCSFGFESDPDCDPALFI